MAETTTALGPKVLVQLHSLKTEAFNGKKGMISGSALSEGRWQVILESGATHNLKPENLKPVALADLAKARDDGSWKTPLSAPKTRAINKYYGEDPDGYDIMRKRAHRDGDIKSCNFDHALYKAMAASLNELGHITTDDWKGTIWKEVADGSGGKPQLTCNERWTLRFGLGDFAWDFDARHSLLLDLPSKLLVMDVTSPPKEVKDAKRIMELLRGPTLQELGERAPKKAKTENGANSSDKTVWVDGMLLDKEMLAAAREAVADDGVIDALEAVKIFNAVADDDTFTRCERWTLRFILSAYVFTDAAFNFLKEACFKLKQTDDLDP